MNEIQGDLFDNSDKNDALAHFGQVAYLLRGNRYIFYLITKSNVNDKPTEEDFEKSLIDLRNLCEKLNVQGLSVPRLGTGLDCLKLEFVKDAINRVFTGCNIRITMYYL
ncbi:9192_t:CDS:2 [Diversispora eburnea]|uniref:9192_t:CDS:1 n=1 Tax=Diversispora eburnea TaxID=1213867 RepID=A0A9N8VBD0_9GLOM|nr:9192_t:CDS:2 [Diversispora eburnea]